MKKRCRVKIWGGLLLGFGLVFCQVSTVLGATETPFSVSLGFDFASGDYGTDQNTESSRIPLTIGYTPNERMDFELVIPYIYQSNSSTLNIGDIRYPRHGDTGSGGMGSTGGMSGSPVSESDSQSGVGDTTLTAGYIVRQETENAPLVRPLLYAKLPTGDADRGLGTGAFDFGAGLSLAKGFGNWFTYAETTYIVPGSTSTFNPVDYWTYLISASYYLTERLAYGVDLSGAAIPFDGLDDAMYLEFNVNYWTSERGSVGGYISKGMTNVSADYGVGFFGSLYF